MRNLPLFCSSYPYMVGSALFHSWLIYPLWIVKQFLTLTVWWAVPVIWLPVVCWSVSRSVQMGVPSTQLAASVFGGIFLWTFLEYSLHRFLFHIKTSGYWLITSPYFHLFSHSSYFPIELLMAYMNSGMCIGCGRMSKHQILSSKTLHHMLLVMHMDLHPKQLFGSCFIQYS